MRAWIVTVGAVVVAGVGFVAGSAATSAAPPITETKYQTQIKRVEVPSDAPTRTVYKTRTVKFVPYQCLDAITAAEAVAGNVVTYSQEWKPAMTAAYLHDQSGIDASAANLDAIIPDLRANVRDFNRNKKVCRAES